MSNKIIVKQNKLDYYLVTIYGDEGHHIFIKEADNAYFLLLLKKLLTDNKTVEITAYCLLSDRIDLLLHQASGGGVTKLMHDIVIDYNRYYFNKYAVDDILAESKYSISIVKPDDVLKISGKIHTNSADWLDNQYSSLRAYLYNDSPDWLAKRHISDIYGSAVKYYDYLNNYSNK